MTIKPPQQPVTTTSHPLDEPGHQPPPQTGTDLVVSRDQTKEAARKAKAQVLNRSIENVEHESEQLETVPTEQLNRLVEIYSTSSSTFLSGVAGGAIGVFAGAAVSALHVGLVLATGPIGLALGAAVGILWFRGRSLRALERAVQKINGALLPIKAEIASLREDAPPETRDRLYGTYNALMSEYAIVAKALIAEK